LGETPLPNSRPDSAAGLFSTSTAKRIFHLPLLDLNLDCFYRLAPYVFEYGVCEGDRYGRWYDLRGSNGGLVMFGTNYATEEAAMGAVEITKKKMCKHRSDVRIKTGFTVIGRLR
jgi:hypothetical protein